MESITVQDNQKGNKIQGGVMKPQKLQPIENISKQVANPAKMLGQNYILGKTVGKGTFGKVKIATHTITGEKVAIKILQKDRIVDVADVERVSRQIHILKLIRHPSIIQLYQILQTPKHLFLIMEYVQQGQLFEYIVKNKKLPEQQSCRFFQQIVGGVQYLHKLNVVHRDLKPENLLISYDHTLRLVDFGLSNTYRNQQRLKTACGSPCYAAPEMIESKNKYDPLMVDIWSCGVILYAMLCGCLPFQDNDTSKLYQKILAGQFKVPKHLSSQAKDFLCKILTVDPDNRTNIKDMRQHSWWKKSILQNSFTHGIIIGYHRIPVDYKVLAQTSLLGFNADFTKKCIEANRQNSATTTYYLLLKKHVKNGGISDTCLGSKYFNPALIQPIRHISKNQNKMNSEQLLKKNNNINEFENLDFLVQDKKKIPSFSFNALKNKQRKNKTLQVRAHQTFYEDIRGGRQPMPQWSVNNSKQFRRNQKYQHKTSDQKLRESPAITIKKYRNADNALQTLNLSAIEETQPISRPRVSSKKQSYHVPGHKNTYNDRINRKYKQFYGVPIISKSKEKQQRRSGSRNKGHSLDKNHHYIQKIQEEAYNHTKFHFNQTIYSSNKKNYQLGADLGFDDDRLKNQQGKNNLHHPIKMPYLRKVVFH